MAHPAQLSSRGQVLTDNCHNLIDDCRVTQATGTESRIRARSCYPLQELNKSWGANAGGRNGLTLDGNLLPRRHDRRGLVARTGGATTEEVLASWVVRSLKKPLHSMEAGLSLEQVLGFA